MTGYRSRELASRLANVMETIPVVVISGLRQTGKSTMLQHEAMLAKGRIYRTLDDFALLAAARSNPESLLGEATTLDEVQRCPELLVAIKRSVDNDRRPGRFLLSGSANLSLLHGVSESLTGRAAYFALGPMTRREIEGTAGTEPFLAKFLREPHVRSAAAQPVEDEEVLVGGLPPACLGRPNAAVEWFRGYVQTYIERDVRDLAQIGDLVAFRTLVQLAALRTGQVFVASSFARDCRLSVATAARYIGLLEASFAVRRLPPFLNNRSSRLIKSPKYHFTDSGLAAHMAGVDSLRPGRDDLLRGALFETYAAQNVSALLEAHVPQARMAYWHEQGRHEVDFVVDLGRDGVCAIEVKAATRWADADLAGLRAFLDRTPACSAAVLAHNGTTAVQLGPKLWAIPLGHLLA